jgi:hypothetical protein
MLHLLFTAVHTAPPAPTGLMVEFQADANSGTIFVGNRLPRFSWQLEGSVLVQLGYQLQVQDQGGTLSWDSGQVKSNRSSLVEYDAKAAPLLSDTAYIWRVRWWGDAGSPSGWATAGFRTTLFDDVEWEGAQYIRCATIPRCLYLRSVGTAALEPVTDTRIARIR